MNQQTISSLTEIQNRFPDAVYFTPVMIAATVRLSRQQVYKYCRQLWPKHEGHYRFWNAENLGCDYALTTDDLQKLLKLIQQNHRKIKF